MSNQKIYQLPLLCFIVYTQYVLLWVWVWVDAVKVIIFETPYAKLLPLNITVLGMLHYVLLSSLTRLWCNIVIAGHPVGTYLANITGE